MALRRGGFSKRAIAGAWLAVSALVGQAGAQSMQPQPNRAELSATPRYVTGEQLQTMTPAELESLYRRAWPGPTPRGRVHGLPIVSPGTSRGPAMSRAARVVWQGKVFRDDGATAVNRFFGLQMIQGNLSQSASWLDGRPSLILDYQDTSVVYGRYRDEIRQVAPGLYLGLMYARTKNGPPTFTRYFAFETRP